MKESMDSAAAKWKALGFGQRIMIIVAVIGVGIGGYVVYTKANEVPYSVLYANADDTTASDVLAKLDSKGIPYRLEGNGTRILVPTSQLASTRLSLASEGVTGQPVPEGFDEIFANQGLASSDFEQRVNYERALEGELARTLLAMDPVVGASVQLSIPEQSIFIGGSSSSAAEVPTASVMLSLKRTLTPKEIDTVANVISSSVEGLKSDQVTIASSDGTLLRAAGDQASAGGSGSTKNIDITRDYESALSTRLTELAKTLTGQAGATVEVRAVLDFTESTVESEKIDPLTNVPTAESDSTETWSGSGSQVGGSSGVDGGPAATGTANGDGTYSKEDKTTTYTPGDRTITKSVTSTPTVTKLSIAVVVPVAAPVVAETDSSTPVTEAPVAEGTTAVDEKTLSRLIGSAAGIDTTRGDSIEVAMVPATLGNAAGTLLTQDPTIPTVAPTSKPQTTLLLQAAGGGAFVMLILAMTMRRRRRKKEKLRAALASNGGGKKGRKDKKASGITVTEQVPMVLASGPTARTSDPDQMAVDEIKGDLERMLAESPESLAALLSSWMAK